MRPKNPISYNDTVKSVNRWITVHNKKDDTVEIDIDGVIGEDWWTGNSENTTKAVKAKLADIANIKAKKIIVNINSIGGDLADGLGIHDVLASHPAEIETNVTGFTASAATVIAQAGDYRKISSNALYLIHQPWSVFVSNLTELEQSVEDMRTITDNLIRIYSKRSNMDEKKIRGLINENNGNGKWLSADEALDYGLVDEVYEPMKAAALPDMDLFNAIHLPEIPNNQSDMKTEEKNVFLQKLDDLKNWITDQFKALKGDEDDTPPEVPENVVAKLTEFEATIQGIQPVDDELAELQQKFENLTASHGQLQTEYNDAQDKIKDLTAKLTQSKAQSTKVGGREGIEDGEDKRPAEMKSLSVDLTNLRNELQRIRPGAVEHDPIK